MIALTTNQSPTAARVKSCLVTLGFPEAEIFPWKARRRGDWRGGFASADAAMIMAKRRSNLWKRDDLPYLLKDARQKYLDAVKLHHPDHGGDHETMVALNSAWKFIERAFAKKGITLD